MSQIFLALQLKKDLDALRPIAPALEAKIMQKLRIDWSYHSNSLEGNSLTFGETKTLLLHGITAGGKPLKDSLEITGHNEAIETIIDFLKQDRPLTESFIRHLHQLILQEPYKKIAITADGQKISKDINIGEYKTKPNHVLTKTGEILHFAEPIETPAKMHDLLKWCNQEIAKEDVNPIILAAKFHYDFVKIHPFDDGNGRIARILMNFILMKCGFPPAIIKTQDRESYLYALRQADGGEIEPFIEYIAQNVTNSLKIMIKGVKGEEIEDNLDKKIEIIEENLKNSKK